MKRSTRDIKRWCLAAIVLGCGVWIGTPLLFGKDWGPTQSTIVWIGWTVSMSGAVAYAVAFLIERFRDSE